MEQLKDNIAIAPFMGDNKQLSVGLNPLGMRTASEQLFTTLLPGMNVVTLRIRYYSFYCWLLSCFYANRLKANRSELQRHIRMSELLMALIHAQSTQSGGVPGITRALTIVTKGESVIDFNEDAMPGGKPIGGYWKGQYGAFGTYYAASLQEMGIIAPLADNQSLYNVTPKNDEYISGAELAEAFANSVGKDMALLFCSCAAKGVVTSDELAALEPYFQSHNMPETPERDLLLKMILQNDRPASLVESTFRKNTLRLLLTFVRDKVSDDFSELEFARFVYDQHHQDKENSTAAVGWYAYYLNDSRQFQALNIFDEVLNRLPTSEKPGQLENIDEFTTNLAEEVGEAFHAYDKTVKEVIDSWDSLLEPDDKMAHAFYIILDDFRRNPQYVSRKSVVKTFFRGVSNDALDSFDVLECHIDVPFTKYIKDYLTENIIYNHYSESMRKYSQNGIPTQKLAIENGYVRGLSTYAATHSSPRIDTLRNYATDLGLIVNNKISPEGVKLLEELQNDRTK